MKNIIFTTAAASVAMIAAVPASAQMLEADTYNGVYVQGAFGLDAQKNDGGDGIEFDTDRDGEFGNTVRNTAGSNAFSPGFCNGAANGRLASSGCVGDDDDYGYAVRIGYDTRVGGGMGVAGVLVEGSTSDARDFSTGFSTTPASYTTSRELDYAISARGRLGISPGDGRGLIYATGGVSYARIKHGFATTNGANSFDVVNDDDMVLGGQIGAGGELMIAGGLTLGLEYLYQSYNDDESFVAVGPGTAGADNPFLLTSGGTNLRNPGTDFNFTSFRATLGYRF